MSDFFLGVVLYAKEGREKELGAKLTTIVGPSRKDEGNKIYDLFSDQSDPRRFVIFERWTDEASQQKHMTSPHMRDFGTEVMGAVEKLEHFYKLSQIA